MRLIDADALDDKIAKMKYVNSDDVRALVANAPTIEAEPVKHGKWIGDQGKTKGEVIKLDEDGMVDRSACCSCCDVWLVASDEYAVVGRFCPNCGAKMDESE